MSSEASSHFEWEYLGNCQFPTNERLFGYYSEPGDCGEVAIARVRWDDGEEMLVCAEHLAFMLQCVIDDCSDADRIMRSVLERSLAEVTRLL